MMDDRLDDMLRDAACDYNEPPETPREEMWERIVAERPQPEKSGSVLPFRRFQGPRPRRVLRVGAGIAALLALGIGLGRMSVQRPGTVPAAAPAPVAAAAPRVSSTAYHLATTEHLSQSETFLTL